MVKCSAPMCGNASYKKTPEITFHRFPKDQNIKLAWLTNMKRQDWKPSSSSVLCSQHFESHLVDKSGFRTVLAPGAIPTIFDLLQENIPMVASGHALPNDYVHNVQPSTSSSTASPQHEEPSFKRLLKRSASGQYILQDIKKIDTSPSSARSQHNMPTSITTTSQEHVLREIQNNKPPGIVTNYNMLTSTTTTSQEHVLREIQNIIPPGVSSVVTNYDEDNRKKDEEMRKMKHKTFLKNKKIKALKQQKKKKKKKIKSFIGLLVKLFTGKSLTLQT